MPQKKIYTLGIMDERRIDEINRVVSKYAEITMQSSSHMYFEKQPINANKVVQDVTFFQMDTTDEKSFEKQLKGLINELKELDTDIIIRDEEKKKLIVTVDFGGYIIVKFDKIKLLKPNTYDLIDEIKTMKTENGYCKGFKPKFRPVNRDLSQVRVNPEIIYLVSDSDENLKIFGNEISERLLDFDPDFELEFGYIEPQEF